MLNRLKRFRKTDHERVRLALSRAADRGFRRRLKRLRAEPGRLENLREQLAEVAAFIDLRQRIDRDDFDPLKHVDELLRRHGRRTSEATPQCTSRNALVVTSDTLFSLHCRLFPAERMAVLGGRHDAGQLRLTSCFDVTSAAASHAAYTRADPEKLGAALVAMEKAGARLVAWAHSHPGTGPAASFPSPTDHRQYAQWIANYSPLYGLILTIDGYVRFWGRTAEGTPVLMSGTGTERIDHDLYRIDV